MRQLRTPRVEYLVALIATVLLIGGPAFAQAPPIADSTTAFQVDSFEPQAAQGNNLLNLFKTDTMQHFFPSAGVFLHYVDDPLELVEDTDDEDQLARIVKRQFKAELWFSLGLFDIFDIGAVLPVVLSQSGQDLSLFNRPSDSVGDAALGDLRLTPKVRIISPEDAGGLGLGLALTFYLPTGDEESFNSYGELRGKPTLVVDWRDQETGFTVTGNVGYMIQPRTLAHNLVLDDSVHWGVGFEIPTPMENLQVLASVFGSVPTEDNRDPASVDDSLDDIRTTPIELDAAVQYRFGDYVVNAGGGAGLTRGAGAPDFRLFAGFGYVPVTADTDGDGILDHEDECPLIPEDFDGFEDEDGCPDNDNDKDGIPDVRDGAKDGTGYGKCRDLPEDKDGFEDEDGCPDTDNDSDGILDVNDGCPMDPEDFDKFQDEDGCPDNDNDGDGVQDRNDGEADETGYGKCRNEPETVNEYKDEDGCPDEKPKGIRISKFKIELLEKVFFDYNKDTIKPISFSLLNEVARVITEHPQLTKMRVEGHTDHRGSAKYNTDLSQRRAASVVKYLVSKGVDAGRLSPKGWGEERPLVTGRAGRTEAGMAKNRRVEIHIIEVNGKPHSPDKPVVIEKKEEVP